MPWKYLFRVEQLQDWNVNTTVENNSLDYIYFGRSLLFLKWGLVIKELNHFQTRQILATGTCREEYRSQLLFCFTLFFCPKSTLEMIWWLFAAQFKRCPPWCVPPEERIFGLRCPRVRPLKPCCSTHVKVTWSLNLF